MNKVFYLMALSLFVSCGGPSGGGSGKSANSPANEQPSGVVQYAPLFADIADSGISIEGSPSLNLMATRRQFAAQPIIIKNNSLTSKPISIVNTLDSSVEVDNRCPATLEPRRICVVTLYYNRPYDQALAESASKGSLSITSDLLNSNISVAAGVNGDSVEQEVSSSLSVSKLSVSFSSVKGESKRDFIVIRNTSKFSLPSNYNDSLVLPESGFSLINNCPSNIPSRRICVVVIQHDSDVSDAGSHSASFSIAEKTISLSSMVDPAPVFTSNPNISWDLTPPASAIWTNPSSFNFKLQSELDGQSLLSSDFSFGSTNQWPAAFSWSNTCPSVLDRVRTCDLSVSYDPEMFHFGVEFTKTALIKDQEVSFELTGNSPCNPSHPNARPDAALGKKLNPSKTACIDNLGVFDSPDSVYGHAVFQ